MSLSTPAGRVRLGAVDDHPVLLAGLRAAVAELAPAIDFVAQAVTVPDLLSAVGRLDVVLLDLRLNDGSRPGTNVRMLRETGASVLVYTEGSARSLAEEAIRAGAAGVLRKDRPPRVLIEAIGCLAAGGEFASEELAQTLDGVPDLRPQLSDRERETLTLYAAGLPTKQVARQLGVGIETAREYLKRIKAKYAAMNRPAATRLELLVRAVEDGLVDPVMSD